MNRRRFVIGNWKRYIESPREAIAYARALRRRARSFAGVDAMIAPPFPLIPIVGAVLKGSSIHLGAQALSPWSDTKHTGDVSAALLVNSGVKFVIVGHSERRAVGESEEMVSAQMKLAIAAGLTPVLCVGERERDQAGTYFAAISSQLSSALAGLPKQAALNLLIAYEPIWAIGKSAADAMKPQDLQEMVIFIRKTLADMLERSVAVRVPILYGGSVEPENATALIEQSGISGFLVGHASADVDSFVEILKACKK